MTNYPPKTAADRKDWVAEHREMYLRSGGAEGHIMDITPVGGRSFATHCLIKYKGRKSGKVFITALCYGDIGGEVVIVGSKGGADTHPDWYLNRSKAPTEFQIATQAFRGTWRQPEGAEREKVWNFMVDNFPSDATYQKVDQLPDPAGDDAGGGQRSRCSGIRRHRAAAVRLKVPPRRGRNGIETTSTRPASPFGPIGELYQEVQTGLAWLANRRASSALVIGRRAGSLMMRCEFSKSSRLFHQISMMQS